MTGILRRLGHQITQCAPVSAFAWIAGQGSSPAGAIPNLVGGDEAPVPLAQPTTVAATSGSPDAACPPADVEVLSTGPLVAPALAAVPPVPAPSNDGGSGGAAVGEDSGDSGRGAVTSYIVGPRTEYHTDVRYLQIDDRDTTVSQQIMQKIIANGDVHTEVHTLVGSGDGSTVVHLEQVAAPEDGIAEPPDDGFGEGAPPLEAPVDPGPALDDVHPVPETASPETASPEAAADETAGPETTGPDTTGPDTTGADTMSPAEPWTEPEPVPVEGHVPDDLYPDDGSPTHDPAGDVEHHVLV